MELLKSVSISLLLASSSILLSCSGNKEQNTEDIWVAPEPVDTIASSSKIDFTESETIDGRKYSFHLVFQSVDSLPIITSFSGQRYKDNGVDLTVRNDSSEIFNKHFTKSSFSELVPSSKLKNMSLVDFYYNYAKKEKGSKLYFLAKVGDPEDNDENFYFIDIQINRNGDLHMERANMEELTTQPLETESNSEE